MSELLSRDLVPPLDGRKQERRVDNCVRCGRLSPIAAEELCYRCYRRDRRGAQQAVIDRHNPGIRKEQKKLIKAFAAVMGGLSDLAVRCEDILEIKGILAPYLAPVSDYIGPGFEHDDRSEQ